MPEGDSGPANVVHEPPGVASDGCNADVDSDDHVPSEQPRTDEALTAVPRRDAHDAVVGRVEAERGRWQTVRDQVDPKQLNGDERLGHAEEHRQEDADDLADVRRDCRFC